MAMQVPGGGGHRSVDIRVSIDPDDTEVRVDSGMAGDGANRQAGKRSAHVRFAKPSRRSSYQQLLCVAAGFSETEQLLLLGLRGHHQTLLTTENRSSASWLNEAQVLLK